jgi:hypothetical protein
MFSFCVFYLDVSHLKSKESIENFQNICHGCLKDISISRDETSKGLRLGKLLLNLKTISKLINTKLINRLFYSKLVNKLTIESLIREIINNNFISYKDLLAKINLRPTSDSKSDIEQQFQQQAQLAAAANFASFYPFLFNKQKPNNSLDNMFSYLNYSPIDFRNPFLFPTTTTSNNTNLK